MMIFGKHINKYYLKYWYLFLLGIISLVVVDYAQLLIPSLLGDLVEKIELYGVIEPEYLLQIVGYMALIALVMFVGRLLWRVTLLRGSIFVESDIRKEMFVHAEQMSQKYFQKNKTGALMALFTNDLETIKESISDGTIYAVDALFLGTMAFIKMAQLNWILAIISIAPLLVLACCGYIVGKFMEKKYALRQEAYEKLSDFAQENFSGISVIKAFVKEAHELRQFTKYNKDNQKINIEYARYTTMLDVCIELLIELSIVLIIIVGGFYVYDDKFTAASLIEFIGLFDAIIWPMIAFAQIINIHSRGTTSLKRVSELLNEKVEILDYLPSDVSCISGDIEFKNFSFTYPDSDVPSLHNISFKVNKGETIGIVGKIGCGKTTLVNVLLRLYNVEEGTIFIDGVDLMKMPIKLLRDSIGYVPQDNFLFSDKVGNNIRFANKNISQEETEDAARFADVDENIKNFVDGYNTMVGERGVTLSGGQKQRISIARAIVKEPSILILDDSVSAVDVKTEEKILHNIKEKRAGKTTIIVASRVSTVSHLDKILVLKDGSVEAFDSPSNLMKISPTYKRMVELQELEKEVEGE